MPLETRRFVMMTIGGYWPVILKLPNGDPGVVTGDGVFQGGERGRSGQLCPLSPDPSALSGPGH
jgi:hypothetical protein